MTTTSNTPKENYESQMKALLVEFKQLIDNEEWANWWEKFLALEKTGIKNGWVKPEFYNED